MLAAEPPRTPWDLNFPLFGIPVRVHPMFWVVGVMLGLNSQTAIELATWIIALFVSILVHELGHAVAARSYGHDPWITLYAMGGLASYEPSAYGARRIGSLGHILITAAGPAAGFALAAVLYLVLTLAHVRVIVEVGMPRLIEIGVTEIVWTAAFSCFINDLFFISVFWGLVNLLPVYPLDGGQIAREVLTKINPFEGERWSLVISFTTACLVALVAFVALQDWQSRVLTAGFFAYLAYWSYAALSMGGPGSWR